MYSLLHCMLIFLCLRCRGPAMKLYMSEDAVSACLQRLSLENDHSYGGNGLPKMPLLQDRQDAGRSSPDSSSEDENVIVDPGDFCMSSCKVMSVCPLLEEKLRDPRPESVIPESLLHSLTSPCLELVLWSPPSGPIHQLLRSLAGRDEASCRKNGHEADERMEL
ncbi:hypothetical protein GDO78_016070 [Eleutherodactylus coqui]|uniref:Uncharacterized protein n=2 Tax=Eleutherodactylus coqui TaxID=57060 RepID=A0A8J6JYL4_ELECQ|nr:hypothetical protein GDO78_016070 [Eleutherodactylus coqui]